MQAVVSADRIQIPVGSVLRLLGSWEDYCQLRDGRGDGYMPRVALEQPLVSFIDH